MLSILFTGGSARAIIAARVSFVLFGFDGDGLGIELIAPIGMAIQGTRLRLRGYPARSQE